MVIRYGGGTKPDSAGAARGHIFAPDTVISALSPSLADDKEQLNFSRCRTSVSLHDFAAGGALQGIGAELIVIDLDILIVDAGAVQAGNRLAFQFIQLKWQDTFTLPLHAGTRNRESGLCNVRQLASEV